MKPIHTFLKAVLAAIADFAKEQAHAGLRAPSTVDRGERILENSRT